MRTGRRNGAILLFTIIALVAAMALVISLLQWGFADLKESDVHANLTRAFALAEGATEIAQQSLVAALASNVMTPTGGMASIHGLTVPFTIAALPGEVSGTTKEGFRYHGNNYDIYATGSSNGMVKRVDRVIQIRKVPIYEFTVFYNQDLEIHPGTSDLDLHGRIFTNGDMYFGADKAKNLKLYSDYVRAAGHIYRRNQVDDTPSSGNVKIMQLTGGTVVMPQLVSMDSQAQFAPPSTSGFDSSFAGYDKNGDGDFFDAGEAAPWSTLSQSPSMWNGTVQDSAQDVATIAAPSIDLIKMYVPKEGGDYVYNATTNTYTPVAPGTGNYAKGELYATATVAIIDNKIEDAAGNNITASFPAGTLSTSSFYDDREGKLVTVTNVDVAKLKASGKWPADGLIYAARTDATPSQPNADGQPDPLGHPNGIRLMNASEIGGSLTFVSQDPVYVWGDLNSKNKKPSSIICDAVNVLSDAFNDPSGPYETKHANPTTINSAFITGIAPPYKDPNDPTKTIDYNGGFENFFRFHEKWDGVKLYTTGSYINAWLSQIAQAPFNDVLGNRYSARDRTWDYDYALNYLDPSLMPNYTPSLVFVTRVLWESH